MSNPKEAIDIRTTNASLELPSKVEVTKNTKGFTWTISCRCEDGKEMSVIDRIENLNGEMLKRFKSEV